MHIYMQSAGRTVVPHEKQACQQVRTILKPMFSDASKTMLHMNALEQGKYWECLLPLCGACLLQVSRVVHWFLTFKLIYRRFVRGLLDVLSSGENFVLYV